jgi:hypothetical protein
MLTRFYRPTPLLEMVRRLSAPEPPETKDVFRDGLSALDDHKDIPAVVSAYSAYFGYDGPNEDSPGLAQFTQMNLLDVVCVLGKYTYAKKRVGFNKRGKDPDGDRQPYRWAPAMMRSEHSCRSWRTRLGAHTMRGRSFTLPPATTLASICSARPKPQARQHPNPKARRAERPR